MERWGTECAMRDERGRGGQKGSGAEGQVERKGSLTAWRKRPNDRKFEAQEQEWSFVTGHQRRGGEGDRERARERKRAGTKEQRGRKNETSNPIHFGRCAFALGSAVELVRGAFVAAACRRTPKRPLT